LSCSFRKKKPFHGEDIGSETVDNFSERGKKNQETLGQVLAGACFQTAIFHCIQAGSRLENQPESQSSDSRVDPEAAD